MAATGFLWAGFSTFDIRNSSFRRRRRRLHPDWMPGDIPAGIAAVVVPTRADVAAPSQVGGVETQTGDDGEGVAGAGINCHPTPAAPFAKAHEIAGGQGRAEHAAAM